MGVATHKLDALSRVAVDDRNTIQQVEDPAGREFGLSVVRSEGPCLSCPGCAKHQRKEHHNDLVEVCMCHVAVGECDLEGAEAEDNSIHEVDDGLGEGVGDSVHYTVEQSLPAGSKKKLLLGECPFRTHL